MKKNNVDTLKKQIKNKQARIGIIGLGYVGLPLAVCFAKKGFTVTGIDIDKDRINKIKDGVCYILDVKTEDIADVVKSRKFKATNDFKEIKKLDAVIICVPTPLGKHKEPDISYIREAVTRIKENIKSGQIIVLESTTYPGTTEEILKPVLESTGMKEGKDFYLAFSPERVDPGNELYKTVNTPKIIGGLSAVSTDVAKLLYDQVIEQVIPVSSASAAEMVKLLENTFRIVNIAMVNELAVLCERLNLNIWEIIDAAKTKPYGYMAFYPGPGVGGHCIPVDPLYLSWKAKEHGFETKFIDLASHINEKMPLYAVTRLEKMLEKHGKGMGGAKVLVLGVAYKKDTKDLRESPATEIIHLLKRRGAVVSYYDPLFPYFEFEHIDLDRVKLDKNVLKDFDAALLVTDHTDVDYAFLAKHLALILDTRNIFGRLGIKAKGIEKL